MPQGPGYGDGPSGPTGIVVERTIYINARSVQWYEPTIRFKQVVEQWNSLDPDRHVIGELPRVRWTSRDGKKGIFYPSDEPIPVVDQLAFKIDDSYLA